MDDFMAGITRLVSETEGALMAAYAAPDEETAAGLIQEWERRFKAPPGISDVGVYAIRRLAAPKAVVVILGLHVPKELAASAERLGWPSVDLATEEWELMWHEHFDKVRAHFVELAVPANKSLNLTRTLAAFQADGNPITAEAFEVPGEEELETAVAGIHELLDDDGGAIHLMVIQHRGLKKLALVLIGLGESGTALQKVTALGWSRATLPPGDWESLWEQYFKRNIEICMATGDVSSARAFSAFLTGEIGAAVARSTPPTPPPSPPVLN